MLVGPTASYRVVSVAAQQSPVVLTGSKYPPLIGLICATFVILKVILYQYFRFVCVVSFAPPAKQSAIPNGLTTTPF